MNLFMLKHVFTTILIHFTHILLYILYTNINIVCTKISHTHTNTHIKQQIPHMELYNNTNIKCTLSEYKMHIMHILSTHYSLLLEDPMSISSLVSSLEVSSTSISSSSLLPSSTMLGDSVVCTCSFLFLKHLFLLRV